MNFNPIFSTNDADVKCKLFRSIKVILISAHVRKKKKKKKYKKIIQNHPQTAGTKGQKFCQQQEIPGLDSRPTSTVLTKIQKHAVNPTPKLQHVGLYFTSHTPIVYQSSCSESKPMRSTKPFDYFNIFLAPTPELQYANDKKFILTLLLYLYIFVLLVRMSTKDPDTVATVTVLTGGALGENKTDEMNGLNGTLEERAKIYAKHTLEQWTKEIDLEIEEEKEEEEDEEEVLWSGLTHTKWTQAVAPYNADTLPDLTTKARRAKKKADWKAYKLYRNAAPDERFGLMKSTKAERKLILAAELKAITALQEMMREEYEEDNTKTLEVIAASYVETERCNGIIKKNKEIQEKAEVRIRQNNLLLDNYALIQEHVIDPIAVGFTALLNGVEKELAAARVTIKQQRDQLDQIMTLAKKK